MALVFFLVQEGWVPRFVIRKPRTSFRRELLRAGWAGSRSAQQPAEKRAEDQAERRCLPEVAAGYAGGIKELGNNTVVQAARKNAVEIAGSHREARSMRISGYINATKSSARNAARANIQRELVQFPPNEAKKPLVAAIILAQFRVLPGHVVAEEHV